MRCGASGIPLENTVALCEDVAFWEECLCPLMLVRANGPSDCGPPWLPCRLWWIYGRPLASIMRADAFGCNEYNVSDVTQDVSHATHHMLRALPDRAVGGPGLKLSDTVCGLPYYSEECKEKRPSIRFLA